MRLRAISVSALAALFAVGTSVLPLQNSPIVVAADEGVGLARAAALGLETSAMTSFVPQARYQSISTSLSASALEASSSFAELEAGARYQALGDALEGRGLAADIPFDVQAAGTRYQALSEAGRDSLSFTDNMPLELQDTAARYQALSNARVGSGSASVVPSEAQETTARYQSIETSETSMGSGAATTSESSSVLPGASQSGLAAAALAMAPLAEHESDEDEDEDEEDEEDTETFEGDEYDYSITFDTSTWQVVDQTSEEDENGNPSENLQLASEAAFVNFSAWTTGSEDAEECVAGLVDFIEGIEGVDNADIEDEEGDEEDALVVLEYEYTGEDDETTDWTATLRCQTIEEEESYLLTWYDNSRDLFEDDEDAREELLDGVEVG